MVTLELSFAKEIAVSWISSVMDGKPGYKKLTGKQSNLYFKLGVQWHACFFFTEYLIKSFLFSILNEKKKNHIVTYHYVD